MIDMKFDMHFKNIKRTCNSIIRFSKLTMLIYLIKFVALGYN